jgi:hypothetical protein
MKHTFLFIIHRMSALGASVHTEVISPLEGKPGDAVRNYCDTQELAYQLALIELVYERFAPRIFGFPPLSRAEIHQAMEDQVWPSAVPMAVMGVAQLEPTFKWVKEPNAFEGDREGGANVIHQSLAGLLQGSTLAEDEEDEEEEGHVEKLTPLSALSFFRQVSWPEGTSSPFLEALQQAIEEDEEELAPPQLVLLPGGRGE